MEGTVQPQAVAQPEGLSSRFDAAKGAAGIGELAQQPLVLGVGASRAASPSLTVEARLEDGRPPETEG